MVAGWWLIDSMVRWFDGSMFDDRWSMVSRASLDGSCWLWASTLARVWLAELEGWLNGWADGEMLGLFSASTVALV
jgi:hypothetical protein